MRVLSTVGLAAIILACAGATQDTQDDENDSDRDTTDTNDSWEVPDVCLLYLECTAAVAPGALDAVASAYGAEGSCWAQGEDFYATCESACATGTQALLDLDPYIEACYAEAPAVTGCPFAEDDWVVTFATDPDSCSWYSDGMQGDATFECDNESDGAFTLVVDVYFPQEFTCTAHGLDFVCIHVQEDPYAVVEVQGTFGEYQWNAEGSFTFEYEDKCTSGGTYTIVVEPLAG